MLVGSFQILPLFVFILVKLGQLGLLKSPQGKELALTADVFYPKIDGEKPPAIDTVEP